MSLKYEPSSEPLQIYVKLLFSHTRTGPFEKHAVVEIPGQPGNLNSVRYFFYTM